MAGSLKLVCTTGQTRYASTAAFATLNAQTAFTVSSWFEIASAVPANIPSDLFAALTTGMVGFGTASAVAFDFSCKSAVPTSLHANPAIDSKGHFVVISYSAAGTTTIYLDGAVVGTSTGLGTTDAVNQAVLIGYDTSGPAITIYFKDLAIWGGHSLLLQDVLDLRDGVHTPATLGTPATNWWSLQGTPGAVTVNNQGLIDSIGGVNFGTLTGTGTLTYDAHEIVLTFGSKMLTPFVTTDGNLIIIPLYNEPTGTLGGPSTPTGINIVPTFKKNGTPFTPTVVSPPFIGLYAIVYLMPSGTSVAAGDTVTMAAPLGWASTTAGLVEGTSAAGLGSAAMTLTNNAGAAIESIYDVPKTMKIGMDVSGFGNANNWPGQPRANHISRSLFGPAGWTNYLTFSANGLPLTISGVSRSALYGNPGNKVDSRGTPNVQGLWTLVYGDASTGVTSNPSTGHILDINLSWAASWTIVENPNGTDSAGTWDGSAWTGITKTYMATYSGSGGFGCGLAVEITSSNGHVDFPSKGNGQVEFGVFPPSPTNRNVSSPTNWDPLGIDPEYLLKLAGVGAVRWMPDLAGFTSSGDQSVLTVADLTQRQVNDFLWSKQTTTAADVTKVEPIGATFDAIVDYQGGTQTMSAANWLTAGLVSRVPFLVTTSAPHGLRTGDQPVITGTTAAPAPKVDQTGLKLASNIAATGSPVTFTVNSTVPPLAVGQVILIGSEQMTVTGGSGASLTCTRPTAGTSLAVHSIGDVVSINFLTAAIATTSGSHTITVSNTAGFAGLTIQIDSEQMTVTAVLTATTMTVTQAVNGTTGATHAVNAIVYPCVLVALQGYPVFVTSTTAFVTWVNNAAAPFGSDLAAISVPTIAATVNYTSPNCPTFSSSKPLNTGSVPYEFAVNTTSLIAAANGYETICWINFALLATDALVTYVATNIMAPAAAANPHLTFIAEMANEIFNVGGTPFYITNLLAPTAPNPEEGGTGFPFGGYTASRQHHITTVAKAAFTAAGLNPARVYDFQPGQHQINRTQGTSQQSVSYCQRYGIPIDYLSPDGYCDISTDVWTLWWSWMPTADGGTASWTRPMARRVMMSYFRAWCWFSQYFGGGLLGNAQLLSWYAAGKDVAANGVGSGASSNTGLGKLCFYEAATEMVTTPDTDGTVGGFVHADAAEHDLLNDGAAVWTLDTGWKATETAYLGAMQGAAKAYADVMPSASFPDPVAATAGFVCLFSHVGVYGGVGQAWFSYNWQGQQPGNGLLNRMTIPTATPWVAATPVEQSLWTGTVGESQSIRAQAAIDWIAATSPTPTPTPTSSGGAALLMAM